MNRVDMVLQVVAEGVDYTVGKHPGIEDEKWAAVTILRPEYQGVVVKFGKLSFGKENADETLDCSFQYDIIDAKNHNIQELSENRDFSNLLGDIVIHILYENLDLAEKGTDDEDAGEDSSQKFDL